jgi:hypothetical protein
MTWRRDGTDYVLFYDRRRMGRVVRAKGMYCSVKSGGRLGIGGGALAGGRGRRRCCPAAISVRLRGLLTLSAPSVFQRFGHLGSYNAVDRGAVSRPNMKPSRHLSMRAFGMPLQPANCCIESVTAEALPIASVARIHQKSAGGECYAGPMIATEFTLSGKWRRRKFRP